jgi:hypothetical protein
VLAVQKAPKIPTMSFRAQKQTRFATLVQHLPFFFDTEEKVGEKQDIFFASIRPAATGLARMPPLVAPPREI